MFGQQYGYGGYIPPNNMPGMQNRLGVMDNQQQYSRPAMPMQGRIVANIDEAKVAQVPMDGSPIYFPCPCENKIYVKSMNLDGASIFNVYSLETNATNVPQPAQIPASGTMPEAAWKEKVNKLEQRIELLESLIKGAIASVQQQPNANHCDAAE